jgi:hypothetical protein
MKNGHRWIAKWLIAVALLIAPAFAHAQMNPIDDVLKLAFDAFNDFKYITADTTARKVLTMQSASPAQRARAQMIIAASAFPEEAAAQKRVVALAMLKQLLRTNYEARLPQELTWVGLDSLMEEARRTTFGVQVTGEAIQTAVGIDGAAKLHFKANKPGLFRMIITARTGNSVAVVDSLTGVAEGEISFKTMRDERPVFSTGDYNVMITAYEPGARGDTVTTQYTLKVDAPALAFVDVPAKMDSSKLLKERSGKYGAKAILPAIMVGGATFALSSVLHGEGALATGPADTKGVGVAGGLALVTILAGFADNGRLIPANIAANQAAGQAFEKSVADAQAENRRRITEHRTVLTFDMGAR